MVSEFTAQKQSLSEQNKDAGVRPELRHLAIIMDGNGRWAESRGLQRSEGHSAGTRKLREVCIWCIEEKIPYLSVYAFSTENWRRPASEVKAIMDLILYFYREFWSEMAENGVRCKFAGDLSRLSLPVRNVCRKMAEMELREERLCLVICLNYGGRDELLRAFQKAEAAGCKTADKAELTEEALRRYLDLPDLPDPDMILRPGGEKRLSNFWVWQAAYAELYFSDVLWPDFSREDFDRALAVFRKTERRYGGLGCRQEECRK